MNDMLMKLSFRSGFDIEICFFGRLVKEQNVIGFKSDDSEFFSICSIVHLRNLLSLLTFRLILIEKDNLTTINIDNY